MVFRLVVFIELLIACGAAVFDSTDCKSEMVTSTKTSLTCVCRAVQGIGGEGLYSMVIAILPKLIVPKQ